LKCMKPCQKRQGFFVINLKYYEKPVFIAYRHDLFFV
jgi:hypothetical protein